MRRLVEGDDKGGFLAGLIHHKVVYGDHRHTGWCIVIDDGGGRGIISDGGISTRSRQIQGEVLHCFNRRVVNDRDTDSF